MLSSKDVAPQLTELYIDIDRNIYPMHETLHSNQDDKLHNLYTHYIDKSI